MSQYSTAATVTPAAASGRIQYLLALLATEAFTHKKKGCNDDFPHDYFLPNERESLSSFRAASSRQCLSHDGRGARFRGIALKWVSYLQREATFSGAARMRCCPGALIERQARRGRVPPVSRRQGRCSKRSRLWNADSNASEPSCGKSSTETRPGSREGE